ncbi:Mediator of RNA polymerase II transcription subunit 6 [Candidozyma auris]|uniref:Mediator of RNA polymerase II transcription subunit 6 n=2 Tax=Candidozyma auris TaxID=498019 RepID=A0A2H1A3X9_CANAR|nr:hypothetical_protein [[Candida] auris]KND99722.2 hypothetical protein QG37_03135 [[Candida] auris]PIS57604.1 hypothetical protein CJI97_000649 [[Candida] auris]PIS58158.1 hypothetical protein B9J08_000647 [[Candida] auris]PSK77124.1 hypothetical protein CJJ07_003008 [[Candida] auris]QEL60498.1 hypothetical protein CJJ09_002607 [[Candida] auris]
MSTEPLDEIQWKSPEWIQQFGLHTGNVLDYFAESPFYDRTSSNQVLRMQFQFQQIPPHIHPQKYIESKLTEMVGIEFVIAYVKEPDFWIIRKQRRLDPTTTTTEQDYYIIGANVYQAPKIYDILSARLLSSVLSMRKSIDLLNKMTKFSISEGGHLYPSDKESASNGGNASVQVSTNPPSAMPSTTNIPSLNPAATPSFPNSTPGTSQAQPSNGEPGSSSIMSNVSNINSEVSATAFNNLLNSVMASANNDKNIYLDDIPLYGKGSTVEQLGLKLNLNDDDDD